MMRQSKQLPFPTERLLLRPWTQSDRLPFRQLNSDPRVMKHFRAPLSEAESDALAERICAHHEKRGFGLWAVELRAGSSFIGFTGLAIPQWDAPFTPCVEIGWHLAREHRGHGYATEAARAALAYGFDELRLDEIVAFTAAINERSQRVMCRLGMQRNEEEDFYHTALPRAHPLARHVLYRLSRNAWRRHDDGTGTDCGDEWRS